MKSIVNKFKVPSKQWNKWDDRGRFVFNELYGAMIKSPWGFQSPAVCALKISARAWNCTAWNASWIAADAACGIGVERTVVDVDHKTGKPTGIERELKAA